MGLEGTERARNVVIEFDSLDQALECYNSPEYQSAKSHRDHHAHADLMIIEGVSQPIVEGDSTASAICES